MLSPISSGAIKLCNRRSLFCALLFISFSHFGIDIDHASMDRREIGFYGWFLFLLITRGDSLTSDVVSNNR